MSRQSGLLIAEAAHQMAFIPVIWLVWLEWGKRRALDAAWFWLAGARTASVVIAILTVPSFSDYPVRTSAIIGFAALVCLWFIGAPPKRYANPGTV